MSRHAGKKKGELFDFNLKRAARLEVKQVDTGKRFYDSSFLSESSAPGCRWVSEGRETTGPVLLILMQIISLVIQWIEGKA